MDAASQNSIGDNSNGLQNPLHLVPTLSYAYTTGYTNQRTTSQALTVGLTQSFAYKVPFGTGAATTLTASGTFTWSNSTSDTHTTTVTNSLSAPFDVPKGKIYEEKLLFNQQQVTVPYTTTVFVDGTFQLNSQPYQASFPVPLGKAFQGIEADLAYNPPPVAPPAPYKDVNWGDVHYVTDNEGSYLLHGTLTLEAASTATVKIFDITDGPAQANLVSQYAVTDDMLLGGQPFPSLFPNPPPSPCLQAASSALPSAQDGFARAGPGAGPCWAGEPGSHYSLDTCAAPRRRDARHLPYCPARDQRAALSRSAPGLWAAFARISAAVMFWPEKP